MMTEHKTKQDIRAAARSLFASRGYNAVSMRDIASKIGKQPGGIYNHFTSKQDILTDLMVDNLHRAFEEVITPLDGLASAEEKLEAFVRAHIKFHIQHPDDIFIAYMELRSLEPQNAKVVFASRDRYEQEVRNILQQGMNEGVFDIMDANIQARAILSMLGGVTVWYRSSGDQSVIEITKCYVQSALKSVGLADEAKKERKNV